MSEPLLAAGNLVRKQQRRLVRRTKSILKATVEGIRDTGIMVRRAWRGVRNRLVSAVKPTYRRLRRPVRATVRRKGQLQEQWVHYRTEWQIEDEIETLVARNRTLVVGPWLSEVGFEALYWVPFLQWVQTAFRLEPARLVAVSRGGVGSWYRAVAGRYIEMWDDIDPAEFARRNAERGVVKHYEMSPLDRDVLDRVAARLGTREFDVIHPGLMYRLFTLYWQGQRAMSFVDSHTRFTRMEPPAVIDPALLPREYVAVKFYAARSLPDTPAIRAYLRTMVENLSERLPVVLLDTGLVLEDDHADYAFSGSSRIIAAKRWMTPQNNLGVQTQIVGGARAFVGTCGSIAWLAPRLGIDTSALYVDPKWLHGHLPVAMRAYHRLGAGRFSTVDLRALDPLAVPVAAQA